MGDEEGCYVREGKEKGRKGDAEDSGGNSCIRLVGLTSVYFSPGL